LPYVDQFLYENGISIVPDEHSLIQVVGITESGAYLEAALNIIPFSFPAQAFTSEDGVPNARGRVLCLHHR